jgi:hypothetical protein
MSNLDIKLHKGQSKVIRHLFRPLDPDSEEWKMRFCPVVGSRGFGKSYLSGAATVLAVAELERMDFSVPNKNIALLCGSHTQVVDIYYPLLAYNFGLEARCEKSSRVTGKFIFSNGTEVKCWSADAYERLRGSGQYLVIADEIVTWSVPGGSIQDAFESVIEPTVVTRWSPKQAKKFGAPSPGRILIPSTPKGRDYFYDLSVREITDDRWKTFSFTYKDTPLLSEEEIEKTKKHMDPVKFAREYLASFEESGANVFHSFDRRVHLDPNLEYFGEDEVVHAAIDFNIALNCTSFSAIRGNQLHVLDEHQGAANTEELAKVILKKFPKNKVICYPDPSGRSRKTSAPIGVTDFSILREHFEVLARSKAPPTVDSVAAVNRKLMNAAGDVDMFIHPRCSGFTNSLERTVWVENRPESATIDKSMNTEHFSDGIRYLIEYLWPVTNTRPVVIQSNRF